MFIKYEGKGKYALRNERHVICIDGVVFSRKTLLRIAGAFQSLKDSSYIQIEIAGDNGEFLHLKNNKYYIVVANWQEAEKEMKVLLEALRSCGRLYNEYEVLKDIPYLPSRILEVRRIDKEKYIWIFKKAN